MAKITVHHSSAISSLYRATLLHSDGYSVLTNNYALTPEEARRGLIATIVAVGRIRAERLESLAKEWREACEALRLERSEV